FVGVGAETQIARGLTLFADYQAGWSSPSVSAGALVTGYGTIRTESFALGLVQKDLVRADDRGGFVLSQPLRAVGGSAALDVPYARDFDGNVLSRTVEAPLSAEGHEIDLQAFYAVTLSSMFKFDAGL